MKTYEGTDHIHALVIGERVTGDLRTAEESLVASRVLVGEKWFQVTADVRFVQFQANQKPAHQVCERHIVIAGNEDPRLGKRLDELPRLFKLLPGPSIGAE